MSTSTDPTTSTGKSDGQETLDAVGLAASIGTIALGTGLLLDDYKDIGLLGNERDPPMPHHYQYGLILIVAGVAGACYTGLSLLKHLAEKNTKTNTH